RQSSMVVWDSLPLLPPSEPPQAVRARQMVGRARQRAREGRNFIVGVLRLGAARAQRTIHHTPPNWTQGQAWTRASLDASKSGRERLDATPSLDASAWTQGQAWTRALPAVAPSFARGRDLPKATC